MAIPRRTKVPGTFFVTSVTYKRRRLFQLATNAELFLQTLLHYQHEGQYRLHAFVVMPDHVHLLLTPQDVSLERAVGLIKGGFSHRMHSSFPVWQKGFTDHRIRDKEDFEVRREYIRQNPVRAHLVERSELYIYSSAYGEKVKRDLGG